MDSEQLIKARRDLKYTQKELADRLWLSSQHISRMERGTPIPKTVELSVLRLLDVHKRQGTKAST